MIRFAVACALFAGMAAAQTPPVAAPQAVAPAAPCRISEASRALDFWVGDWDVYVGRRLVGHDIVTRELNGCAVTEVWIEGDVGGDGKSLFYFDARKDLWTQVWVTGDTSQPGGVKLKVLRRRSAGSTTFQGEIEGKSGAVYYDRTTLTQNPDGTVHQVIEVSRTGDPWRVAFDAIYVNKGTAPPH